MKLTEDQINKVINVLEFKGIPRGELEGLTTFDEFDHWWTMMFGYRYSLAKFLGDEKI